VIGDFEAALDGARTIAVLWPSSPEDAVFAARALVAGGIGAIEIALRTNAAEAALAAVANALPDVSVGAGTVISPDQVSAARAMGARFVVSPGLDEAVVATALAVGLPCLPGVATPSEVMRALALGLDRLKFFPAEAMGGRAALAALAGPFPGVRFCPTGGIDPDNARAYLGLDTVFAVAGSWMAPAAAIAARDSAAITALAQAAVASTD
jgi:2-dehydro-3-deoxyphosphogluconate aldolase/(4S)-4-hydroxy-2-oxoglutarate aldolase